MLRRILIIAGIIVLIMAIVMIAMNIIVMSDSRNHKIISAYWSVGGGMTGGHTSINIRRIGDEAVVVTESQEWHNSDLVKTEYKLSEDVFEELEELVYKARIPVLSRRGYTKMFALDGDTFSFSCYYDNGHSYSVSQTQRRSNAETKKLMAIRDYLYSLTGGEGVTEVIPGDQPAENTGE